MHPILVFPCAVALDEPPNDKAPAMATIPAKCKHTNKAIINGSGKTHKNSGQKPQYTYAQLAARAFTNTDCHARTAKVKHKVISWPERRLAMGAHHVRASSRIWIALNPETTWNFLRVRQACTWSCQGESLLKWDVLSVWVSLKHSTQLAPLHAKVHCGQGSEKCKT